MYVINLAAATTRRALIRAHLDGLGIVYEWVDAVAGNALDLSDREQFEPLSAMSPGAVGCYLSHIRIYARMLAQHIPVALVLEDDTVLHYRVATLLQEGCRTLDFDYCFLGCSDAGDGRYIYYDADQSVRLSSQHQAYALSSGPNCTNAYLITLEGARKRMQCAFPVHHPIDHYHYLPYQPRFMATMPMCAFVNAQSVLGSLSSADWSVLKTQASAYWWYYPLRDVFTLRRLRKLRARARTVGARPGRWTLFDSAFRIVRRAVLGRRDAVFFNVKETYRWTS